MTPVEAVETYLRRHEAFRSDGGAAAPDWVQSLRQAALTRFEAAGFPTAKHERWRFTSVDGITKSEFTPAPSHPSFDEVQLEDYLVGDADSRIVAATVNGRFLPRSGASALPAGIIVTGIADAVLQHRDLVRAHLARHANSDDNPFTALGTAFLEDGIFVYVPKNLVVDRPVQIVHFTAAGRERVATSPRVLVVVEAGAQLSVIETYAGTPGSVYWTNAVTESIVGENAVVDAYRIQRDSTTAYHTAVSQSHLARNSVYSLNAFAFGSALNRVDLNAVLDGEGAEATLNGLTLVAGRQHVDYHTTIDHAKPHCNSWELFNGIYDDQSRGVFTGRIIVRPGAQKTDSKQTNNNLLLSKTARADSQPQLEIYADDVRCTHGATLGPIDQKSLFYLQSRGLGPDDARNLLTYGFGAEVLNSVSIEELRETLDALVRAQLESGARTADR